jgi:hypothetical protein
MGDEQEAGFIRQRRNLMIVSLVLLFSELAELEISKLSVFGNDLLIGEPRAISGALWVAGFYWLLRFYQYSRPGFSGAIRDAIHQRVQQIACPTGLALVLKDRPEFLERIPDVPVNPVITIKTYTITGQRHEYLDMELELEKAAATGNKGAAMGLGKHRVRIAGARLRYLRCRAWIHLIVHTRNFTDFILPYVLFGLPLAYVAYDAAAYRY